MRKVRVALGEESYDILIGYGLEKELQAFVQGAGFSKQAMLVTDSNVGPLYGEKVRAILEAGGLHVTVVTIPAGESSKCLAVAEKLYTRAIELGLDRKSPIFALGGRRRPRGLHRGDVHARRAVRAAADEPTRSG